VSQQQYRHSGRLDQRLGLASPESAIDGQWRAYDAGMLVYKRFDKAFLVQAGLADKAPRDVLVGNAALTSG
jgi:hypothetical protein